LEDGGIAGKGEGVSDARRLAGYFVDAPDDFIGSG
jgi:hypothetical protein